MTTSEALVALSRWVNEGNADRSSDALLWIRCSKPAEEAGEVISALNAVTGANPRKGAVDGVHLLIEELLDTAVAALAAVEHLTGHAGAALVLLDDKVRRVHDRALGASSPTLPVCDDPSVGGCARPHGHSGGHVAPSAYRVDAPAWSEDRARADALAALLDPARQ